MLEISNLTANVYDTVQINKYTEIKSISCVVKGVRVVFNMSTHKKTSKTLVGMYTYNENIVKKRTRNGINTQNINKMNCCLFVWRVCSI